MMFKSAAWRTLCLMAVVAVNLLPSQSAASGFNGYTQLMSNYIGRGLAQSVGEPSLQTEFEYIDDSGFYADLDLTSINWIDQLYPGDSVSVEVDIVLAFRRSFAQDGLWKAGFLRLQFPGRYVEQSPAVAEPHTTEVFGYIGWKNLSAKLNYSLTDAFGTPDSKGTWYLDLSASKPVQENWLFSAHVGRKQARGSNPDSGTRNSRTNYNDFKLAAAYLLPENYSVEIAKTWTTANPDYYTLNDYNVAGHHWAFTVKKAF